MTETPWVAVFLGIAAWSDWKDRTVSNNLVIPSMVLGIAMQAGAGKLWFSLAGCGFAFVLTILPVLLHGMGMGDQKLLMTVGAWTGWRETYDIFLMALLFCVLFWGIRPESWKKTVHNLTVSVSGWRCHRLLWIPPVHASALPIPFAVTLFFSYLILMAGIGP